MDWLIEYLKTWALTAGMRLISAILVLIIGFKIVSIIVKKIKKRKTIAAADVSVTSFVASFVSIGLRIAVIISVIAILGIPMSSIVALVASAGVAIGLAVQGALGNLVGGIMILIFKPFKVGDYIEAEGASGTVNGITVFYTVLATPDNKKVTVPNGSLTNSVVTNYSAEETRRMDFEFVVSHDEDIKTVKRILLSTALSNKEILTDPAPMVMITACNEKGVTCCLRIWCFNDDYWNVRFALLEDARNALKKKNINIHYPRLEVNVNNVNNDKENNNDKA